MLKAQDVLVILKLFSLKGKPWTIADVAKDIGLSQSEVHSALKRLVLSGLFDKSLKRPRLAFLEEFLLHGLKFVFPTQLGRTQRGIVTAHSAPPLDQLIVSDEAYVWPDADGTVRGASVEPLYPSAPRAAANDPLLYKLLALIDAIRVGRARERLIAAQEIKSLLRSYAG